MKAHAEWSTVWLSVEGGPIIHRASQQRTDLLVFKERVFKERIFEEMSENSNLMKNINLHIQEAQLIPSRLNANKIHNNQNV